MLERSGALNRLIALLDRLVGETPFREDRWARLVRALGRAGRRADALQTFERAGRLLADELGVEPGDDLRQAEAAVLLARPLGPARRGEACTRSSAAWPRAVSSTRSWSPSAVAAARSSSSPESRASARAASCTTSRRTRGVGRDRAHGRVRPHVGGADACAAARTRAHARRCTARHARALQRRSALPGRTRPRTQWRRRAARRRARRFMHAVSHAIVGLAQLRPTVLVIDDVQWADGATRCLLQSIATEEPDLALLVVCTLRSSHPNPPLPGRGDIESSFVDLARSASVTWLPVPALAPDEVGALVDSTTGTHADDALIERVRRASGGNPLYAIQLARLLGDDDGTFPQPLPRDLTAVLRARVAEIDSDARDALRVAAVVGQEFSVSVLAAVLGRRRARGRSHARDRTPRRTGHADRDVRPIRVRTRSGPTDGVRRSRREPAGPAPRRRGARAGVGVPGPADRGGAAPHRGSARRRSRRAVRAARRRRPSRHRDRRARHHARDVHRRARVRPTRVRGRRGGADRIGRDRHRERGARPWPHPPRRRRAARAEARPLGSRR